MLRTVHAFIAYFATNQRGATAIEYGLIAALVFLGLVGGFTAFAGSTTNMFSNITSSVQNAR